LFYQKINLKTNKILSQMKKFMLSLIVITALFSACKKEENNPISACPDNPKTDVPSNLQGNWMYGNFSMKEYWGQNPSEYLGNALQYAIAFKLNADGTYEQYFTSSTVSGGTTTYQQSVTKGTVVIDETKKTMVTHACSARYKKSSKGQTIEERDLIKSEITATSSYTFNSGTEQNGAKVLYLTLQGTTSPLTFLEKF
jgi:hypothetical protein